MKSLAKVLLLAAVAVTAIAVSVAPSEAAKKKRMMKTPTACTAVGASCTMGGTNVVHFCGGNQKWTPMVLPACTGPGCPPPCK